MRVATEPLLGGAAAGAAEEEALPVALLLPPPRDFLLPLLLLDLLPVAEDLGGADDGRPARGFGAVGDFLGRGI